MVYRKNQKPQIGDDNPELRHKVIVWRNGRQLAHLHRPYVLSYNRPGAPQAKLGAEQLQGDNARNKDKGHNIPELSIPSGGPHWLAEECQFIEGDNYWQRKGYLLGLHGKRRYKDR